MTRKIFVCILVLSIFSFTLAPTAEAFWPTFDVVGAPAQVVDTVLTAPSAVADPVTAGSSVGNFFLKTADHIKDFVLKPLAIAVARSIIRRMTVQTVNWINSGFKGNPMYVTNTGQFFMDQADTAAAAFVQTNGILSSMCSPFQAKVRMALVKAYLGPEEPFACTLDTIANNFDAFTDDFSQGGWAGWFEMTQSDMGNPYGAYLTSQEMMNIKIGQKQAEKQNKLDQGKGFLSWETCDNGEGASSGLPTTEGSRRTVCLKAFEPQNDGTEKAITYNPPDYGPVNASCTQSVIQVYQNGQWVTSEGDTGEAKIDAGVNDPLGNCPEGQTRTNTPGSVIEAQLEQHLGTGIRQLELTNDINMLVSALFTQLINQIMGGIAAGLRGTSQPHSSPNGDARSLLQSMADNSPEVTQEASDLKSNINSSALPQFNTDSKSSSTSTRPDLFWTPPTDQELNSNVENLTDSVPPPADAGNGSVTCVTDKMTGDMTCQ